MRLPDWPQRLAAKVEEWRFRPFKYGETDCLQFAAEAVEAVTGVDHRQAFPRYASEMQAGRILVRCRGVDGLITSVLGPAKPPAMAGRGDIVMGDFGNGLTAGVCVGVHCCSPGERGLEFRPTRTVISAWSV